MTQKEPVLHQLTPVRTRTTWTRWDPEALRMRTSRRYCWLVTDLEGYERSFDTRNAEAEQNRRLREALEHIVESAAHPSPTVNEAGYLAHVAHTALNGERECGNFED